MPKPRGPKILPGVQTAICQAIRLGASQRIAAKAGGVSRQTLTNWLTKGRGGDRAYLGFLAAYEEAETRCDLSALAAVEKGAKDGYWKAAAWRLARRHPEDYGDRTRTEIEVVGEDPVARLNRLLDGK